MAALSPRTKSIVQPMFDFPLKEEAGEGDPFATFILELARTWGTRWPLYLDLSRFDPDEKTTAGRPLVTHLFAMANQAHLKAIPVAAPLVERRGKSGAYFDGVAAAARRDGRGAAIRIPFHDLVSPSNLSSIIEDVERAIGLDDAQCDVFLDAGPTDSLPGGQATAHALLSETLLLAVESLAGRKLRSLVFCSSSIPKKSHVASATNPSKVANVEFHVWSALLNDKSRRHVRFGDYGPRFANQTDKPSKAQPPARIHLSTSRSHTMYVAPGSSYRELAKTVIDTQEFSEQCGTWGKFAVRDAGAGSQNVGSATDWVARDVHMHVETFARAVDSRMREASGETPLETSDDEAVYGQQYLPLN